MFIALQTPVGRPGSGAAASDHRTADSQSRDGRGAGGSAYPQRSPQSLAAVGALLLGCRCLVLAGCAAAQQQYWKRSIPLRQFILEVVILDLRQTQLAALANTSDSYCPDGRVRSTGSRPAGRKHRSNKVEGKPTPRHCSDLPSSSTSGVSLLQLGRSQPPVSAFCDMIQTAAAGQCFRGETGPGPTSTSTAAGPTTNKASVTLPESSGGVWKISTK